MAKKEEKKNGSMEIWDETKIKMVGEFAGIRGWGPELIGKTLGMKFETRAYTVGTVLELLRRPDAHAMWRENLTVDAYRYLSRRFPEKGNKEQEAAAGMKPSHPLDFSKAHKRRSPDICVQTRSDPGEDLEQI